MSTAGGGRRGRRFARVLLVWALSAGAALGAGDSGVRDFGRGIEALDYGSWRTAALLLDRVLEADPREGGRPDVQVYGQRWVPYLPHFFLGVALFETGRYSEALASWETSTRQLEKLADSRRQRSLERYLGRNWRRRGLAARFFDQVLPATERAMEQRLPALRRKLTELARSADAVEPPLRRTVVGRLKALEMRLDRMEAALEQIVSVPLDQPEGAPLPLAGLRRGVSRHRQLAGVGQELQAIAVAAAEVEELLQLALLDALGRRFRERRPPAGDRTEPRRRGAPEARVGLPARSHVLLASRLAERRGERRTPGGKCGYSDDPATAIEQALSDYLAGAAMAGSRSCSEIRAVAEPRLHCSLELLETTRGLPNRALEPYLDLLEEFRPYLALATARARCGDREGAAELLALARSLGRADGSDLEPVETWLRGDGESGYPGRSHALVIGIWDYRHWPDLPGVESDFRAVRDALVRQGFTVEGLTNPTSAELGGALESFPDRVRAGDRVVFYYAGHGHVTTGRTVDLEVGWIVPADAPEGDDEAFVDSGLSMDRLRSWSLFELGSADQQLLVLDSCFSGVFLEGDRRTACPASGAERDRAGDQLAADFPFLFGDRPAAGSLAALEGATVRTLLSAGTAHERVPDESLFRRLFVSALDGEAEEADADRDGLLHVGTELGPFLKRRVEAAGSQAPQFRALCPRGDFVFRLPAAAALPAVADRCGARGVGLLEEVFRWEAFAETERYDLYLESSRCGLFAPLARAALRQREIGGPASM